MIKFPEDIKTAWLQAEIRVREAELALYRLILEQEKKAKVGYKVKEDEGNA